MIFNLHIKSQLRPAAVCALLIQSELTPRPRELRQLWQQVQAAGTGSAGDPECVGSSGEQGVPLQTGRSRAPHCLMLEQKQTITPLTRRPRNAKYAVILSKH